MALKKNINRIILSPRDEQLIKEDIGDRIGAYISRFSDMELAELKEILDGCRDTTLDNIIKGRTYPKISLLVSLANHSSMPMCSFIDDKYHDILIENKYINLLYGLTTKQKVQILTRCWCERFGILQMYDEHAIDAMFDDSLRMSSSLVGHMLKFQRKRMGISKLEMSKILGNEERSVANVERGNNVYSFINTLNASNYFNSPIDYFYIGQLSEKNKLFVCDYMLYELFRGLSEHDEQFFMQYIMLYRDNKINVRKKP